MLIRNINTNASISKKVCSNTFLISYESLVNDKTINTSLQNIPTADNPTVSVYPGWMLTPEMYTELYYQLKKLNYHLINTPGKYKFCHYIPENYYMIKDYTPQTIWIEEESINNYNLKTQRWPAFPMEANKEPHAIWWHYNDGEEFCDAEKTWGLPSAEILGIMLRYDPDNDLWQEGFKKAMERLDEVNQNMDMNEASCFVNMFDYLDKSRKKTADTLAITSAVLCGEITVCGFLDMFVFGNPSNPEENCLGPTLAVGGAVTGVFVSVISMVLLYPTEDDFIYFINGTKSTLLLSQTISQTSHKGNCTLFFKKSFLR